MMTKDYNMLEQGVDRYDQRFYRTDMPFDQAEEIARSGADLIQRIYVGNEDIQLLYMAARSKVINNVPVDTTDVILLNGFNVAFERVASLRSLDEATGLLTPRGERDIQETFDLRDFARKYIMEVTLNVLLFSPAGRIQH